MAAETDVRSFISTHWPEFVVVVVGGLIVYAIGEYVKNLLLSKERRRRRGRSKLQKLEGELEKLQSSVAEPGSFVLDQLMILVMQNTILLGLGVYQATSLSLDLWGAKPTQPVESRDLAVIVISAGILLLWAVFYHVLTFNRLRKVAWSNLWHRDHLEKRIEHLREDTQG